MTRRSIGIALAGLLLAPITSASVSAQTTARVDPHIRYVDYDTDAVIRLVGYTGYQMILEFAPGEKIETVGIGDSSGWQVTPNGAATVMFLKPVGLPRTTNMSIVTNYRRYNLELLARSGTKVAQGQIVYAVRFRYQPTEAESITPPAAQPLTTTPPEQWNRAYSYDGAKGNVPEQVFDDAKSTFFRFAAGVPTPAIFSIAPGAGESIVNFSVRGPYVVIEQVAPQFVLRQGADVTYIFNDAYVTPTPGVDAPKPRTKSRKSGFGSLFGKPPKGQTQ